MALAELKHIKKLFSSDRNPEEKREMYREVLVMVLARATDADAYTDPVEVKSVQGILKDYLGEDISSADVRIAASSDLFERAPLEKYLARIGPQLEDAERISIVKALVDVLHSDGHIASSELGFFNMVVEALRLSPAEVAGLVAS